MLGTEIGPGRSSVSQSTGEVSVREERMEDEGERGSESHGQSMGVDDGNRGERCNPWRGDVKSAWANVTSFLKGQSGGRGQVLIIAFAVIILMQVTIVVLLKRPQQIQVVSWEEYNNKGGGEMMWLEKRMHFLREEMLMVEARLDRMRQDHASLKAHLRDLERLLLRHRM